MSPDPIDQVHFGGGLKESDRPLVDRTLAQVLSRFQAAQQAWEMEVSVKDREAPGMVTTLEARIGRQRLVATSKEADLKDALNDCGHDLLKQYTRAREQREPQSNRAQRESIRRSGA